MDPALWAELEGPPDEIIAALVRLVPGARPPPGICIVVQMGDVATVRVRRGDLLALRHDPAVASLKAPRMVVPERRDDDPRRRPRSIRSLGAGQPSGRGAVVGIVDWGCDFTHPNLRHRSGRTRLLALWDQGATTDAPAQPYGYGVVHHAREIDRALASSDAFGALGYDPLDSDDDGSGSHGTHVIDIAAGRPRVGPGGVAPGAHLVFVQLASPRWEPRRIGSSVCLVEAVDFICRIAGDRPWVVNLSMGSHGGPHDGSTLAEQALDAIVVSAAGRTIIHSCGNYRRRPIHTSGRLSRGEKRTIDWLIDTTDTTPNEIEVWYPGSDTLAVDLIAPDGTTVARAVPDSHGPIVEHGRSVGRFAHRRHDPNNCDNQALLVVDPTRAGRGRWQVVLEGLQISRGDYHVWIERDEGTPGSQSRLARRDAVATTTTGSICNGHHTIAVGAYDPATRSAAWFSSLGPTRDGRAKPDVLAHGVGVLAARSAPDDDGLDVSDDEFLTCKSGTSMAAPRVTGAVAVLYEAASRPLTAAEVRKILIDTARPLGDDMPGLLDLRAAVDRARSGERSQTLQRESTGGATTRIPRVMFELDVHYGFRDEIDRVLQQTVPLSWDAKDIHLTKHKKKTDFFNVKRDLDRLEIGTERFELDANGRKQIDAVKLNLKAFADELLDGFTNAKARTDISLDGIEGHPRLFPLPHRRKRYDNVLVHKLHIHGKFPHKGEGDVWASPQAHMTIPLAKVGALIEIIDKSRGESAGHRLTGSGKQRMGLKSDHLYKAKRRVEAARRKIVRAGITLSNGTAVDSTTFTDQLAGLLMLQASYLWVIKLWEPRDTEFFGKGHLPINVKTPFPDIFNSILTPTERLIYTELFADSSVRRRMWRLVDRTATTSNGDNLLFPEPVGDTVTWNDLLDWTLGLSQPFGDELPGGGTVWEVSDTAPLVALELRRIGYKAMYADHWGKLIDTIVEHTTELNR